LAAAFTRSVAAYTAGRLLFPYLAVAMWNNASDNEEIEEELSEADHHRFRSVKRPATVHHFGDDLAGALTRGRGLAKN